MIRHGVMRTAEVGVKSGKCGKLGFWGIFWRAAWVVGAMASFVVLARRVKSGSTGDFDAKMTRRIQAQDGPVFDRLMHVVSWPGFPPQSWILPWAIPLGIRIAGYPLQAVFQLAAWLTTLISFTVKRIMKRPRPDLPDVRVADATLWGTSFPSGHVLNYVGVYGFLAYLAHRHIGPRIIRWPVVGGLTSMIALVGPSRVYLGHHWFSDVLASYLLGTSWLVILTSAYRRVFCSRQAATPADGE